MILAIDIGNTTVALGGIKDGRVCFVAHMDTVRTRTAAEYRIEMEKVFAHRRHPEKPIRFEGAVLTSVVPQITGALAECARYYTGKKPVIVSPEIRTGLTMGVPDPMPWARTGWWMPLTLRRTSRCRSSPWIWALPLHLMLWMRTGYSGAV